MTTEQFYNAIRTGAIKAGSYTLHNGNKVEVFNDGEGWIRREYLAGYTPTQSDIIESKVAADRNHPCRIVARFRWKGTDNDCVYGFDTPDQFDTFCERNARLILQDVEYRKARYIKGYTSPVIRASFRTRL